MFDPALRGYVRVVPRPEELPEFVGYYASLIAGLVVSAAREDDPERLKVVHDELRDAIAELVSVVVHEARG